MGAGVPCASCGRSNRDGARFCAGCGCRLAARCAACGTGLVADGRFCDACGATVVPDARQPEGARKVVTVLFADVVGSTSYQERVDAESARAAMGRVHAVLGEVVAEHGGTVVKFVGDGVMAVFGHRAAREDDAVRAVRAGLALQARIAGTGFGLRVGVNTGEVVVDPFDDDVIGDPVNVAARLETAAEAGSVLIGEETARLVRDHLAVEAVAPLAVRGRARPVRAHRALDRAPVRASSPFVGREADVDRLAAELDLAAAAGRARLVTVLGSPGLGKSRLAEEAAKRLARRATVLTARCDPAGGTSLGPLVTAIRRVLGVADDDLGAAVRAAVAGALGPGPDAERLVDRVVDALGATPVGRVEESFWALRRLVESMARAAPVVVVLDDAHWAEPALLDLLEHLAAWLRRPALLVALGRPELRSNRPSLVDAAGPSSAVLALGALDGASCRRIAADLLGSDDVPPAVLDRVLATSDGNPLFLRELLRMLVDDGVLRRSEDGWTATVEAQALELPASIHAVLAARIEQLDDDEREVLEAAAVVGPEFVPAVLTTLVSHHAATALDAHLETLRRRELVDPTGRRSGDDHVHRFHHVLIRDAAYRRILKERRVVLHERCADWLEARTLVEGEHDEAVGWHLERASGYRTELANPDAEGNRSTARRAAGHLGAAGRRALDRDDAASAASLLGRASALLPAGDPERTALLRDRAEALLGAGDAHGADGVVADLVEAADGDAAASAIADVYVAQLASMRSAGALHDAADRTARAARVLAEVGDDAGVAKAESVHAQVLASLGLVGACEDALDRALAAARRAGDARRANGVLSLAPLAALWGPSPVPRASGRCLDVIRVLRITTWAPQVEAHALRSQAVLEALRDRPDAARSMLDRAGRTFEDLGDRVGVLDTTLHAGLVELLAGDPADAEGHLRAAMAGYDERGMQARAARAAASLARALLLLGRVDEAEALSSSAQPGDDLKAAIGLLGVRAEALARRGEVDTAEPLARRAVALAEPTDALVDHADARLALARVLRAAGRVEEAVVEAGAALALYATKGAVVGERAALAEGAPPHPSLPLPVARRAAPLGGSAAARVLRRRASIVERGATDELDDLLADDVTVEDRRPGMRTVHHGRADVAAALAHLLEVAAGMHVDVEVVASRGECLCLARTTYVRQGDGAAEVEQLVVAESDDHGVRLRYGAAFEPADEDAARNLLDERFISSLEPERQSAARLVVVTVDAYNRRALDEIAGHLAPGFVNVDSRPGRIGTVGRDDYLDLLRGLFALTTAHRSQLDAIVALRSWGGVAYVANEGTTADGGRFELSGWVVGVVRDGGIERFEWFDEAEAALACLAELDAEHDVGVVARRGELVLRSTDGGFELGDPRGGDRRFGPEEAGEALEELDQRWLAALDPARRPVGEVVRRLRLSLTPRSGVAFADLFDPRASVRDHRPLGWGELDGETYVTVSRSLGPLVRAVSHVADDVVVEPWGATYRVTTAGRDTGGGDFRYEHWSTLAVSGGRITALELFPLDRRAEAVARLHELGDVADDVLASRGDDLRLVRRGRWFVVLDGGEVVASFDAGGAGHLDAAHDVLDARWSVTAPAAVAPVVDACLRYVVAVNGVDPDSLRAAFTPDAVIVDHRPAGWGRLDLDAFLALWRARRDLLRDRRLRGRSLQRVEPWGAVCDVVTTGTNGDGLEVVLENWSAVRVVDGRVATVELFAADAVDDADACLDRWCPSEHGGLAVAATGRLADAIAERSPDAVEACFAAGAIVVDHRHEPLGHLAPHAYAQLFASLVDEVGDIVLRVGERVVDPPGRALFRLRGGGTWGGGTVEIDRWFVLTAAADGITRLELFDADRRADAEACFAEALG